VNGLRSYKAVVAAVVLALVLLAPLLGQMAKAAAYPQPGTGLVYTKLVTVGGAVTFDFNLTPAYQGAAAHIYLSANGLPNVYYGDVPITPAFSTSNVTAVVGSWPITATAVANFITALGTYGSTEDGLSSGATQETVVLHNLTTQGWALVYLKYSTSAPVQYGGTAPAIAAGPFNLTIRPNMEVTIKPLNNLSVASLCLPTSSKVFLNITGVGAYASGLISNAMSDLTILQPHAPGLLRQLYGLHGIRSHSVHNRLRRKTWQLLAGISDPRYCELHFHTGQHRR